MNSCHNNNIVDKIRMSYELMQDKEKKERNISSRVDYNVLHSFDYSEINSNLPFNQSRQ